MSLLIPQLNRRRLASACALIVFLAVWGYASLIVAPALGAKLKQGISLQSGPRTNIVLGTPYTYRFQVVTNKSYRRAGIALVATENPARYLKIVNLIAHRPLLVTFHVMFCTTRNMTNEGLATSVIAPPSHKEAAHTLFGGTFPLTPVPNQTPNETRCNLAQQPGGIFGS